MMALEDFLKLIQPDLTVFAVLFSFLVLFIKLFWFFLNFQDKLREENLNKIKELCHNFEDDQIVKPLEEELEKHIQIGYEFAVNIFNPEIWDPTTNEKKRKLISEEDLLKIESVHAGNIPDFFKKAISDRVNTKTGQELFTYLEERYRKGAQITEKYKQMKLNCTITWISCLVLSIFSIIGMGVQIIQIDSLRFFWIYTTSYIVIIFLISLVFLLFKRYQINKDWEYFQIYGE